jgi:hypothetical protein
MGISLNGLTPAGTYPGLIKTGDNTAISGTPKVLSDGNGNNLPMEVSTTGVNLTGSPTVNSVAIANTTQVAAKQDTLVSGTNIKTINSTSILGSGNISVVTSPSGVSGAIQFSNGSAFASDAANFFWDNTNKRLGVGTNAPLHTLSVQAPSGDAVTICSFQNNSNPTQKLSIIKQFDALNIFKFGTESTGLQIYENQNVGLFVGNFSTAKAVINSSGNFGIGETSPTARTHIKGSGSTSATTSLLVQNSAGSEAFRVRDDNVIDFNANTLLNIGSVRCNQVATGFINSALNAFTVMRTNNSNGNATFDQFVAIGTTSSPVASAALEVVSTTRGFLPPRMTTTQKNAIASPATGLVLYDSTTNKLQCYNGSTWNDLF